VFDGAYDGVPQRGHQEQAGAENQGKQGETRRIGDAADIPTLTAFP
jgi:hypothetical protein